MFKCNHTSLTTNILLHLWCFLTVVIIPVGYTFFSFLSIYMSPFIIWVVLYGYWCARDNGTLHVFTYRTARKNKAKWAKICALASISTCCLQTKLSIDQAVSHAYTALISEQSNSMSSLRKPSCRAQTQFFPGDPRFGVVIKPRASDVACLQEKEFLSTALLDYIMNLTTLVPDSLSFYWTWRSTIAG